MNASLITSASSICASLRLLSEPQVAAIEAHDGQIPAVAEWTSEFAASFGQDVIDQLHGAGHGLPDDLVGVFKFALLARCLQSLNRMPAGMTTSLARRVASLLNDIGEHHPELLDPECDGAWAVYHEPRGIADSIAYGTKLTFFPRSTLELLMRACISAPIKELNVDVVARLGSPHSSPLRHLVDTAMSERNDLRGMLWSIELSARSEHPDFIIEHLLGGKFIPQLCSHAGDRGEAGATARAIVAAIAARLRFRSDSPDGYIEVMRSALPDTPFREFAVRQARLIVSPEESHPPLVPTLTDLATLAGVSESDASELYVRAYEHAISVLGNGSSTSWDASGLMHSHRGGPGPLALAMEHSHSLGRLTPALVNAIRDALLGRAKKTTLEGAEVITALLTRWDMRLRIAASAANKPTPSPSLRPPRRSQAI